MELNPTIDRDGVAHAGRDARPRPATQPRQGPIGLALCACVVGGWLFLHVFGVFFLPIGWTTAPLVPLVAAAQCWLSVGVFIIAHDAMHGSLVPFRPRTNAVLGGLILFVYAGFSWRRMRAAHMAHHRAPGTEADPDFFAGDPEHFWPWYKVFFARYFGKGCVAFVFTVVGIEILVLKAPVANVVLFYGLPALASSLQLFYFGTYRPHRHEDETFADRHNARTNDFGYLASLLTCFHFGYHHEHHLAPGIPWWALPREHARMSA